MLLKCKNKLITESLNGSILLLSILKNGNTGWDLFNKTNFYYLKHYVYLKTAHHIHNAKLLYICLANHQQLVINALNLSRCVLIYNKNAQNKRNCVLEWLMKTVFLKLMFVKNGQIFVLAITKKYARNMKHRKTGINVMFLN